jgi:ABC-2 type transport system permease protein
MFHLVRNACLSQIRYRGNVFGYLGILLCSFTLTFTYINAIFQYTSNLAGWTKDQAIFILYVSILIGMIVDTFDTSIMQFYRTVALGKIDPFLVRPVSLVSIMLLRWCKPVNLFLIVFLLALWPIFDLHTLRSPLDWVVGGFGIIFGAVSVLLVFSVLSLITFLSQRQIPTDFIVSELYRLTPFPISLFPNGPVRLCLFLVLPMIFSASAPSAALVNGDYSGVTALTVGDIFLGIASVAGFKVLYQKFDFIGG